LYETFSLLLAFPFFSCFVCLRQACSHSTLSSLPFTRIGSPLPHHPRSASGFRFYKGTPPAFSPYPPRKESHLGHPPFRVCTFQPRRPYLFDVFSSHGYNGLKFLSSHREPPFPCSPSRIPEISLPRFFSSADKKPRERILSPGLAVNRLKKVPPPLSPRGSTVWSIELPGSPGFTNSVSNLRYRQGMLISDWLTLLYGAPPNDFSALNTGFPPTPWL